MSSNTPLMDSKEDNSQEEKMAETKLSSEDKSGSVLKTIIEKQKTR